jgi:hypothetical protein
VVEIPEVPNRNSIVRAFLDLDFNQHIALVLGHFFSL